MTPEEEIRRGHEAKQLLANPLLLEAYREIEQRLLDQLAQVEITKERAEYLRTLIVAGRKHRKYLEVVVFGGKQAAQTLEQQSSLRDRAIRYFRPAYGT